MKYILSLVCILSLTEGNAQTPPNVEDVKMEKPAEFKAAEPLALEAAKFLLAVPIDKELEGRTTSGQFLIRWMAGTPDYSFGLDDSVKPLVDDGNLLMLYMASMVRFCIEHPDDSKDAGKVKLESWKIMLAYCDDLQNHVKMNKKLRKMSDANKKGELEKQLK